MSTTGMESNEMSEDPETYDATEIDENKWGALRMIGLLALIAAFAGFVYLAYMQGVRNGAVGAPPVISAETGPYKVAPQNPGGQTFANQDKIIFDRVEGTSPGEDKVASAAPPKDAASGDDLVSHKSAPLVVADSAPPPATTAKPAAAPTAPAEDTGGHADGIAAAIEQADKEVSPATAPKVAKPAPPAETKVATAEPPPMPKTAAPVAVAGAASAYLVQVASTTDMGSAQTAWKNFNAKFADLVGSHAPNYQTADIPGKGTYYRLRVSGFDTKEAAGDFCKQLKAKSQGCLVVKG